MSRRMTSAVAASPATALLSRMRSVFRSSSTLCGSGPFVLAAAAGERPHDRDDERRHEHEEDDREQRRDLDSAGARGLAEDAAERSDERLGHGVDRRNEALFDIRAEQPEGESHE